MEVVTMPDYEAIAEKFDKLWNLREICTHLSKRKWFRKEKTKRTLYKPSGNWCERWTYYNPTLILIGKIGYWRAEFEDYKSKYLDFTKR
jgi:hypothetical protein